MKIEIQVPTKLSDISLEKYQAFVEIQKSESHDVLIAKQLISTFCGIKMNHVGLMKKKSIDEVTDVLIEIFSTTPEFQQRFELGGKEFGFIPNLEDITMDEYIDLDNNIGDFKTMHKAMAVMYRPIIKTKGDKYEIEPYISNITYADVMKHSPSSVAIGAQVFFWNLKISLLKGLIASLEKELKEMSIQLQHSSIKNGDGTTVYTHSLEEMYKNLRELENLDYHNVFSGLHTKVIGLKQKNQ